MKTAAEWRSEIVDYECSHFDGSYDKLILAIQLDAMKEGMRRAAVTAEGETFASGDIRTSWETAYEQGCKDCEKAILTAAEQLTEKDL